MAEPAETTTQQTASEEAAAPLSYAKRRKRGPGGAFVLDHGLRNLQRTLKSGRLDRRGQIGRQWRKRVLDWADDAGGLANMTNREVTLLWHTAAASILVDSMVDWAFQQQTILTANRDMLPILRQAMLAYMNSERRGLEALGLRPSKNNHVPDLAAYIEAASQPAEPVVESQESTDEEPSD